MGYADLGAKNFSQPPRWRLEAPERAPTGEAMRKDRRVHDASLVQFLLFRNILPSTPSLFSRLNPEATLSSRAGDRRAEPPRLRAERRVLSRHFFLPHSRSSLCAAASPLTPMFSMVSEPSLIDPPVRAQEPSPFLVQALHGMRSMSPGQLCTTQT
jgi:hypothetical protein